MENIKILVDTIGAREHIKLVRTLIERFEAVIKRPDAPL